MCVCVCNFKLPLTFVHAALLAVHLKIFSTFLLNYNIFFNDFFFFYTESVYETHREREREYMYVKGKDGIYVCL